MPAPVNNDEFLDLVRRSGVLDEKRLDAYLAKAAAAGAIPPEPAKFAGLMVRDGVLTHFQAEQFLQGKWRRFTIGRYKVLERLGAGGMGSVYLCEHKLMRRRVAVKVLPTAKAEDPAALERFYREARAVAALDHPNIVRAYDIDQDEKLHFLVMEFVDGANFQDIVRRSGPMDVVRAAHYIRQAALGIQHAHEAAGLVHRDIKPGNVLVDRNGIVKVLDMGLARFFHDTEDILTKKYDENVLGTADYLAPEQALDSHGVDIRADIYSLGATFYFVLTGRPPFAEGSVAQKLIWHQTRQPKPVRALRPDVPEAMAAVLERAMAKDPAQRYQTPMEMAEALAPWTQTPIPPPPEAEMPQLSPAAMGVAAGDASMRGGAAPDPSDGARKPWQVSNGSPPAPTLASPSPASPAVNFRKTTTMPAADPLPIPPSPAPAPASPVAAGKSSTVKAPARPALAPVPLRPAPAPARPAVAAAPREEEAAWDKVVSDTADPSAQLDTAENPAAGSGRSRSGGLRTLAPPATSSQRLWIVIGVAAAVVGALVLLGVVLAVAFSSSPKPNVPAAREPLRVDPRSGKYHTLKEALQHAVAGDHILLAADLQEDDLTITSLADDLTIESADPNLKVAWRLPDKPSDSTKPKLLNITSAARLHLKGIAFDGGGKAFALVQLSGACPGLHLENLDFKGFKTYGLYVVSCDGAPDQPVVLSNLRFDVTDDAQTPLYFDFFSGNQPQPPKAIEVHDLGALGPKPIQVKSSRSQLLSQVKFVPLLTVLDAPSQH